MRQEIEVLKSRLVEWVIAAERLDSTQKRPDSTEDCLKSQQPDGSWPDINYVDCYQSAWSVAEHLTRLLTMVRAYRNKGHEQFDDAALRDGILRGLDFWLENDFRSSGWWYNYIHIPRLLGRLMLPMERNLSAKQLSVGIGILKRSWPGTWSSHTGQNLVWISDVTIMRACLEENGALVAEAFHAVGSTLAVTSREGIQPDFSFHQHGPQLYSGGYGWDFVHDCPRLAWAARDTSFAFSEEEIDVLSSYVLDGVQWMMRGRTLDYGVQGRELVRPNVHVKYKRLLDACRLMTQLNTLRRNEFEDLAARLEHDESEAGPVGHRHFWRSDFMIHRRKGYYVSVKMSSVRTFGTEELRGENRQNAHQADGVMSVLRTGQEYRDILPVWDWRRLPGITCRQSHGPVPPVSVNDNTNPMEMGRFVGGASDGTYGLAAFDFRRDGLRARKAWFCFDREIVCLGAGISCSTEGAVLTSVNQCLLRGKVVAALAEHQTELSAGRHSLKNLRWVHHDGIGYFFPEPAAVTVVGQKRNGSWHDVNLYSSKEEISEDVFSVWIDHGSGPKDVGYTYVVIPDIQSGEMESYLRSWPVTVLCNSSGIQAVRHEGLKLTQIAFYDAGKLEGGTEPAVSVDRPCLVMLQQTEKTTRLVVANPENEPITVNVEIDARLTGDGCKWLSDRDATCVAVELPPNPYAGQTVISNLTPACR